jgi:inosine/xanthosine triphosphatase
MMRVIVASTNPVKIEAVRAGFTRMFPGVPLTFEGVSASSGVSEQPMGDAETHLGAHNRATGARAQHPDADYWVGIEGGCSDDDGAMQAFAWVVVIGRAREGRSRTGAFYLPQPVANLVRAGMELGHADDAVFGRANSKQQNGAVGLLTDDAITRLEYYAHAVVLALIPFKNSTLAF